MSRQGNAKEVETPSLAEILSETLRRIEKLRIVTDRQLLKRVFFVKIQDARMLRIKGIKRTVVLIRSKEEGHAAISEGFILALREYNWIKEDEKRRFNGFQFFTASPEKAEEIRRIIPDHAKIPKDDPTRVTFCMMPRNVSLRWLAERFMRKHLPVS